MLLMGGLMGFCGVLIREIPCKVSSFFCFLLVDLLSCIILLPVFCSCGIWVPFLAFNACEGLQKFNLSVSGNV